MKKKLLMLLLSTSLVLGGCTNGSDTQNKDAASETAAEAETPAKKEETFYVKVESPASMDFEKTISLPGTLSPFKEAIISPKVNGNVQSIHVEVGDRVGAGKTILKLDDTFFKLNYNKAKSALESQTLTTQQERKNLERSKALYENGALSQSEFEGLENKYQVQEMLLNTSRVDYDTTAKNLEYTNVTSPISGVVSSKDVLVGQSVGPSSEVFRVVNLDSLYVETSVSEADLSLLKVGQNVRIMSSAVSGIRGTVHSIGPVPNPENKSYPVKILVKNKDNALKPGMFLSVDIISDIHKQSMAISKSAIIKNGDKSHVFVVNGDKSYKKEVTLGYDNDEMVEILSGISTEDKVVVSGKEDLKDESNIIITE